MSERNQLYLALAVLLLFFLAFCSATGLWIVMERRNAADWRSVAEHQQAVSEAAAREHSAQRQALNDLRSDIARQRTDMEKLSGELTTLRNQNQNPIPNQNQNNIEMGGLPRRTRLGMGYRPPQGFPVPPPVAVPGFDLPAQPPGPRSWGPEQATGAPDTPQPGDQTTAWASRTQDGQPEWLQLEYAQAVNVTKVKVYETYNPGALVKVSLLDEAGKEIETWQGKDPTPINALGMGVSEISFAAPRLCKRVKIYLDSVNVPGWNEIDAVGIVDDAGKTHWAASATASSTFAERDGPQPAPQILLNELENLQLERPRRE